MGPSLPRGNVQKVQQTLRVGENLFVDEQSHFRRQLAEQHTLLLIERFTSR
jgi:hypothetical protein